MWPAGTRARSMKTSLNDWWPFIWRSGRTVTPGWCMGSTKQVMPRCLGTSRSVRASRIPKSAWNAPVFHTFCPLITHSSPSRSAQVDRPARSEPAPAR